MKNMIWGILLALFSQSARSYTHFDCRPFLISESIKKGENEMKAIEIPFDVITIYLLWGNVNITTNRRLWKTKAGRLYDFINFAHYYAGMPTTKPKEFFRGKPLMYGLEKDLEKVWDEVSLKRQINFKDHVDQFGKDLFIKIYERLKKVEYFQDEILFNLIYASVYELTYYEGKNRFCHLEKPWKWNKVYYIAKGFDIKTGKDAQELVVNKALEIFNNYGKDFPLKRPPLNPYRNTKHELDYDLFLQTLPNQDPEKSMKH